MEYNIVEYNETYEDELIEHVLDIGVKELGLNQYKQGWIDHIKNKNFINAWIILNNKKIIGSICYCERSKEIAEIKTVYINNEYRRCGIGKLLVDTVVNYIKQFNYKSIYVATSDYFKNAMRFYKKYGFEYVFDEGDGYVLELKLSTENT